MFNIHNLTLALENDGPIGNVSNSTYGRYGELSNRSAKICIISVLGTLIILGNLAVILVIASSVAGWSKNTRYFLISLTGADAALALIVMPLNLYGSLVREYKDEPDSYCHVVAFFNSSIFASCIYSLATISLERYISVFYPLKYPTVLTKNRIRALIAVAWFFPPVLLLPISIPGGIVKVYFSSASLVCNPDYSSNVAYSLTLTALIFFPCSIIMTFANFRLWFTARRQRNKFKNHDLGVRSSPDSASKVLVPVMIVFYTCWTPCMITIIYTAISRHRVPEWVEFVAVWLPSANGFLNCIVYFWLNRSFRRKFQLLGRRLCLPVCPEMGVGIGGPGAINVVSQAWENNNSVPERSCSMSSSCTLLPHHSMESYL
ncbi:probable G-protein coupled receptor 21 [Polyodon spathula]|uniref:probable G-protein coupled receptor 21 n=1 Tax=Polyodon spathula TaxID=7913 RepID=UPI001B7F0FB1|nr:probable G-protein coupled receptor 21 [Polyodon spathula]